MTGFPKLEKEGWFRITAIILLCIFIVAAFLRTFSALQQTSFANGWDAYYYLVQLKSLLEEGRMHSPDYSLIYPLLLLVKWIVSDYVLSYKVTASIIAAFFVFALFFASVQIAPSKKVLAGLLAASLGLFSPSALFVSAQFLKNFLGMTLLIFFIASLPKGKWFWVFPLFALTFLTHRLTGVVAVLFLFLHFANRRYWKWLLGFIAFAVIASVLLPGVLSFSDLGRMFGELQWAPQWAPLSFIAFYGVERLHASWFPELILAMVLMFSAFVMAFLNYQGAPLKNLKWAFVLVAVMLLFPFFVFNAEGPALRLFLAFMLLAPLFGSYIVPKLPVVITALLVIGFAIGSIWSRNAYIPERFDPPYELYAGITEAAIREDICKDRPLVIAHKALAEYFTFSTGKDALPWQVDPEMALDSVVRISYGVEKWELKQYLDSQEMQPVVPLGMLYILMPEPTWQSFLKKVPVSDTSLQQRIRSWENPWRVRPAYITAKRRK